MGMILLLHRNFRSVMTYLSVERGACFLLKRDDGDDVLVLLLRCM